MRLATAISVALATLSTSTVSAQTERDLDSHEHGHAFLNIALDGNTAVVELESPWNNLVGFEHAPSTEEQHAKVDAAMAMLNQPGELFAFNGTECVMSGAVVQSSLGEGEEHHDEHDHDDDHKDGHDDEHDHDDDHKDGHDDEHDHDDDHKDGHDDEHDHDHDHDGEGEVHSSVLASYNFDCSNIGDLQSIEVGLFEKMSGFEEVDVQLIGPGGQDAMELTASQFTVDLGKVR
jgi:hypothetical protein